eukprot:GFUD01008610.1.p1 GENE.GFUD01008610.1~~GFUD01008610.1.p1  ORF type:complete len:230 (+),score=45.01 GFUD01008610.1:147-836(+)
MPAIEENIFLQNDLYKNKRELSNFLSDEIYRIEFNVQRLKTLKTVSEAIYVNFVVLLLVQIVHVLAVSVQAWFFVPRYRQNQFKSNLIFLLGNIFVCLPIKDDRSKSEQVQTIFLLVLHTFETVAVFYLCLFISPSLPHISGHHAYLLLPVLVANFLAISILGWYYKWGHPAASLKETGSKPDVRELYDEEAVDVQEFNVDNKTITMNQMRVGQDSASGEQEDPIFDYL